MRAVLAFLILCLMTLGSARAPAAQALTPPAEQVEHVAPTPGGGMGATEIDLVKWGFTQGGLTLVLLVVLGSYRRDFFRKSEAKQAEIDLLREEKLMLAGVIRDSTKAMVDQAVATNANTKATELLAQNVNNLAERRQHGR